MANVRNANTFYVDTAASTSSASDPANLPIKNTKVRTIIVTATGSNGSLTLGDVTTGAAKFTIKALANTTVIWQSLDLAIVFPNGIFVSALSNCTACLVTEESRG